MKKTWKKIMALVLCLTMITGAGTAYASNTTADDNKTIDNNVTDIISVITKDTEEADVFQDETVFVIASDKGDVQKMIVNDKVRDHVNGTETFTQGESDSDVPVEINISYTLDGREIEPAMLSGKSGHITITYDYVNREAREVEILGEKKTLHVPFAVITGVLLDNKVFSNVTVSGGRVVGDGSRQVALGIGFPGLDAEKLPDIPHNLVIEADVTDFKLGNAYSIVTNLSLGNNFSDTDSLSEILSDISVKAADAMNSLLDGSMKLQDGLENATEGSQALCDGALDAFEGAEKLANGATDAYEGSKQLTAGAKNAYDGAGQLSAGLESATSGAAQLSGGVAQISAGLTTLDGNSAALVAGAEQVFASLLASADEALAGAGLPVPKLTMDNYATVLNGAIAAMNSQGVEAGAAKLTGLKASLDSYNAFYQGIVAYTAGVGQAATGIGQVAAGAEALSSGMTTLNSGASSLKDGLGTLSAGTASLSEGLGTLADGNNSLSEGLKTLSDGTVSLHDGLTRLTDGSAQLTNGLMQLNDELVSKLLSFLDTDATELADTLKALADISNEYKSIHDMGNSEDGSVRFIYKLGSVK